MDLLMYFSLQNIYIPSYITQKAQFSGQHYAEVPGLNVSNQCGNNKAFVNCPIFWKQILIYYLNLEKESIQQYPYLYILFSFEAE
jgi:hypothetical protein